MPLAIPFYLWLAGGGVLGALGTYFVSDKVQNIINLAAIGGAVYLIVKLKK